MLISYEPLTAMISGRDTDLVEENAAQGDPDGLVQVEVGENDEGALAAELQGNLLEVGLGAGGHDGVADLSAAGEAKFANLQGQVRSRRLPLGLGL